MLRITPRGNNDTRAFPRFAVTVDIVLLSVVAGTLHVLLIERADRTHRGMWALPGGFKKPDETLDEAASRELLEETNVAAPGHLTQFHSYGDPGRDPRGNVVTVAYLAAVPPLDNRRVAGGGDASRADGVPVDDVVRGRRKLAFDHARIIRDAVDHVVDQIDRTPIALGFLGPTFTITDIRRVHEAVVGEPLDAANFRRRLLSVDRPIIQPTDRLNNPGTDGGRPATLYRRASARSRR